MRERRATGKLLATDPPGRLGASSHAGRSTVWTTSIEPVRKPASQ
jgi:hypothetical protein